MEPKVKTWAAHQNPRKYLVHFCFSWLTVSCHSASIKLPELWDNNSRKFLKDKFKMVATTGLLWTDYSSNCNVKHTYSKADILNFLLKNVVEENFLSHFTPMPPPIHSLLNFVCSLPGTRFIWAGCVLSSFCLPLQNVLHKSSCHSAWPFLLLPCQSLSPLTPGQC